MIKIVIADDHKMFCEGVKSMLANQSNINIVKVVENGRLLLDYLTNSKVNIVLLDINMKEVNGVEAAKEIIKLYPETKIIILSMYKRPSIIKELIELGVDAYILKDAGKDELLSAINNVINNKKHFDEDVKDSFLEQYSARKIDTKIELTPREKEILKLICESYTTKQIAEALFISANTVESHRKNLLAKTGSKNSIGLVKFAYENQLI